MSLRLWKRKLVLASALLILAVGCTNPIDDISLGDAPADVFEAITGDGSLETFMDAVPEVEQDAECVPDCTDIQCGDDGCGGETCGKCEQGLLCEEHVCVPDCDVACEGLDCGDGGTEGFCHCGLCADGYGCTDEGSCSAACAELCTDLECGPVGDDGECDCGVCDPYHLCVDGACEVDCDTACEQADCTPDWATDLCDCGICDDENVCTNDICQADGTCDFAGLDDVGCTDGDPCTEDGICQAGICVSEPVVCDDGNPCTDGTCNPDNGICLFEPNDDACDDDDVCTVGDLCEDGVCAGTSVNCECETDADCNKLEDGDPCNGTLFCDTTLIQQLCTVDPLTVVECPEPTPEDPNAPCHVAACDPETGECGFTESNEGFPCKDPDLCSVADYCEKGECVGGVDANCNDGNPCTTDTCDPEVGCLNIPNEDPCEDGNPCTLGDQCADGGCMHGPPPDCDDGDVCTDDLCDPNVLGGCVHVPNQADCDDGSICTQKDSCFMGDCLGAVPLDCDDFNLCTDDACDLDTGCFHTPNTSVCDDGDPCTPMDACVEGFCVGSGEVDCDDGNPCTVDLCESGGGCVFLPGFGVCDDGNPCTLSDVCVAGVCEGGGLDLCDDSNLCTTDYCDPDLGCQNADNTLPCDDGDACTAQDTCQGGSCQDTVYVDCMDLNPCTADLCNPQTGCEFIPVEGLCNDGNPCTIGDTCQDGMCAGTGPRNCEDNNPCTTDHCVATEGCVHMPNTLPCDDGNVCTFPDLCGNGSCGGPAVACDDGNLCTNDWCDPAVGCAHGFNTDSCDDMSECTEGDVCQAGVCQGEGSQECDDDNPCTIDLCLPDGGCDYEELNEEACNDGDACTLDDLCIYGECVPGEALDCDDDNPCTEDLCEDGLCENPPSGDGECSDGNPCTTGDWCDDDGQCIPGEIGFCDDQDPCTDNWCDPENGCQAAPNTQPCSDGNGCTVGDHCGDGQCFPGVGLACDDGNPCTDDNCNPDGGCIHEPNNEPCFDGNVCTAVDLCTDGLCVGSGELDCSDDNPCTQDSCDPLAGCEYTLQDGPCTDGDHCTTGDICYLGACEPGPLMTCDDSNACTDDSCLEGKCVYTPNSSVCDDGNFCTVSDHCGGGQCIYEELLFCDDEDPCTQDYCEPLKGCLSLASDGPCSDGDICTTGDSCMGGQCVPGNLMDCEDGNPCTDDWCDLLEGCVHTPNTADCDDGNPCSVGDHCADGMCESAAVMGCDDDNICTTDWCDPALGCMHDPNDLACQDGNPCTDGDTCLAGTCVFTDTVCDDGDPCTDDACDPVAGCIAQPNDAPCDDQNACTVFDVCNGGVCQGTGSMECDDDDICTLDICLDEGGCEHQPLTGTPCNDGDICTVGDLCTQGECVPGPAKECDDDNPCTEDSCDPEKGLCLHDPMDMDADGEWISCDDGNLCTAGDHCADGECVYDELGSCDDGNACTEDWCDPDDGCQSVVVDLPCSDGDSCTGGDHCVEGECLGVGDMACDDGNPCTDSECNAITGCTFVPNNEPCTDGNECTANDHCVEGECLPGGPTSCDDANACTKDACDPTEGCVHTIVDDPCTDFDTCTFGDTCLDGVCTPSGTMDCDDGNPCTDDGCDMIDGCVNTPNEASCTDSSVCTTGDWCFEGVCIAGPALDCNDDNPCTKDICDPMAGCTLLPKFGPCSDDDACTTGDSCVDGDCVITGALDCDDGNPCTDDSCDAQVGCINTPNSDFCDDSNACTEGDYCTDGACMYEGLVDCDDDNICTTDSCDPVQGCISTPNTETCDDGNECTLGDKCSDGQCLSGEATVCDDGNICTDDSCDSDGGCLFAPNVEPCDDQNECTIGDACADGECHGVGSLECDDDNICTKDICLPNGGCDHELLSGTPCSDGDLCTVGDLCEEGTCQEGEPLVCDDDNICSDDDCVEGQCVFSANDAECTDENACTTGDQCVNKQCKPTGLLPCVDDNPCTTDSCDPLEGCSNTPNEYPCDDGNACTSGDHCEDGQCVPAETIECDDGNPCTDDSCDEDGGCVFLPNDAQCSDDDLCTNGDLCVDTICIPGPDLDCDDAIGCTIDACQPSVGCTHVAVDAICNDEDDCTLDTCNLDGGCSYINQAVDCVLGPWSPWTPCSVVCGGGERSRMREILVPMECDGAACGETEETEECNTQDCEIDCVWHWSEWSACSDGCPIGTQSRTVIVDTEPLFGGQACPSGTEATQTQSCSMVGTDCNDDDACTLSDTCTPDGCAGTLAITVSVGDGGCDDDDACTNDACTDVEGQLTCIHTSQPVDCVVGGWTDWDTCVADPTGACTGTHGRTRSVLVEAACGGDDCPALSQTEACAVAAGADCQDGIFCTEFEVCDGNGTCVNGLPVDVVCEDEDSCTVDSCDPTNAAADADGCVHAGTPMDCEVSAWSAWSACSTDDGTCAGARTHTRTVTVEPSCGGAECPALEASEACTMPAESQCTDGDNCTVNDQCDGNGTCTGTSAEQVPVAVGGCDDGDDCTDDGCIDEDEAICTNTNVPVDCEVSGWSDWSGCAQTDDTCDGSRSRTRTVTQEAACGGAVCPALLDTGDCLVDQFTPCDDKNGCTLDDTCDGEGTCDGTPAVDVAVLEGGCNDWDACTDDDCTSSVAEDVNAGYADSSYDIQGELGCALNQISWGTMLTLQEATIVSSLGIIGNYGDVVQLSLYTGTTVGPDDPIICPEAAVQTSPGTWEVQVEETLLSAGTYWVLVYDLGDGVGFGYRRSENADTVTARLVMDIDDCLTACTDAFTDIDLYNGHALHLWLAGATLGGQAICEHTNAPVDCVVSDWSEWSACASDDGTCAGTSTRTRQVLLAPSCDGAECPEVSEAQACDMPAQSACDDGAGCTGNDVCDAQGTCAGIPSVQIPTANGGCDDSDSCTDDSCTPSEPAQLTVSYADGSYDAQGFFGCTFNGNAMGTMLTLDEATEVSGLGVSVNSATSVRLGLYAGDADGPTGSVLCPTAATETSPNQWEAALQPMILEGGTYWLVVFEASQGTLHYRASLNTDTVSAVLATAMPACESGCPGSFTSTSLNVGLALHVWMSGVTVGNLPVCAHETVGTVDCDGSWSAWSSCAQTGDTCGGAESRSFTITQQPTCDGAPCPTSPEVEACTMPAETDCDDGDGCTVLDACNESGTCAGSPAAQVPEAQGGCNDGDICTDDSCADGTCTNTPLTDIPVGQGGCDDGDECTVDGCTTSGAQTWGYAEEFTTQDVLQGNCTPQVSLRAGGMITVGESLTVGTLGMWLESAEGQVALGIYEGDASGPGDLLGCSGLVDAPQNGGLLEVEIESVLLGVGTYWVLAATDTGLVSVKVDYSVAGAFGGGTYLFGGSDCQTGGCLIDGGTPIATPNLGANVYVRELEGAAKCTHTPGGPGC